MVTVDFWPPTTWCPVPFVQKVVKEGIFLKNCVNIAGSNFLPLHGTNTKIEKYYHSEVLASAYSELKITFNVNKPGFLCPSLLLQTTHSPS